MAAELKIWCVCGKPYKEGHEKEHKTSFERNSEAIHEITNQSYKEEDK